MRRHQLSEQFHKKPNYLSYLKADTKFNIIKVSSDELSRSQDLCINKDGSILLRKWSKNRRVNNLQHFTDEKKLNLFDPDGLQYYWRDLWLSPLKKNLFKVMEVVG